MASKIKSISFENFKLFSEEKKVTVPIDALFILDGPNGYGKTTIFDAIEILIKGERNRESSLDTSYKAKNRALPFVNDRNKVIRITGVFEVDGMDHCYLREFEASSKNGLSKKIKDASKLYKLNNKEKIEIASETMYQELGLNTDASNFNLLHYVQQEESTAFLKHSEKDRMDELGKLFNTSESDSESSKINKLRLKLNKLKTSLEGKMLESKERKKSFSIENEYKEMETKPYLRLLERLDYPWDTKQHYFEDYNHLKIVTTKLDELKELVIYKKEFDIYKKNCQITNLVNKESLLKLMLISPTTLEKKKEVNEINETINSNQKWLQLKSNMDKIDSLLKNEYAYIFENIKITQAEFKLLQTTIVENKKSIDNNEKLVLKIQQAREVLHSNHQQFIEQEEQVNCPYCGEEYASNSLEEAYKLAKELFKGYNNLTEDVLVKEKERDEQIAEITSVMKRFNEKYRGHVLLAEWMKQGEGVQEKLEGSKKYLKEHDIDYSEYWLDEGNAESDNQKKLMDLKEAIQALKTNLSDEIEGKMLRANQIFSDLLEENEEQLKELSVANIESKKKYIEYNFYNHEKIKKRKEEVVYNRLKDKHSKVKELKEKIDNVHNIYRQEKKNYLENLLSNLEITLYIYTGKIIQNYPGGLGVFMKIESSGSYLKFLSNYNDEIDIFAKMSTGQLSAFVISLVLAMNRKFSTNKFPLLLIDDPVQSMDDLNVDSFVNLLRNEFSEHQVIVSTHEDHISNFFRYKYKMSNLNTKSLNVRKELNYE